MGLGPGAARLLDLRVKGQALHARHADERLEKVLRQGRVRVRVRVRASSRMVRARVGSSPKWG